MKKKKKTDKPIKTPRPEKHPAVKPARDGEKPVVAEEDLDTIVDEEEVEPPAYEAPEPGEGP